MKTIPKALLFNTLLFLCFIQAIKSQTGPYYGSITQWTNGAYEIRNTFGSVVVGPQNSGWCHIYSDMPNFIFNKSVWSIPGNFSSYSASDLSLQTNGTTRLTIANSTGKVGIGTTTPSYQLHVNSSTNGWTSIIENQGCNIYSAYGNGSNDGYGMHIRVNNSKSDRYAFQIYDGTKFLMHVKNDGNVGIGTNNPQSKLEIFQIGPFNTGAGGQEPYRAIRFYPSKEGKENGNFMDWPTIEIDSKLGLQIIDKANGFPVFLRIGSIQGWTGTVSGGYVNCGFELNAGELRLYDQVGGKNTFIEASGTSYFGGNVAIGCTDTKGYKLAVAGTMVAEKVVVKLQANWPDFVFDNNYKKLSLPEIESYINEHKHLPDVPNEASVKETGIDVAEMNALLLKKIEEMTLLMIEQEKKMAKMNGEIEKLKEER